MALDGGRSALDSTRQYRDPSDGSVHEIETQNHPAYKYRPNDPEVHSAKGMTEAIKRDKQQRQMNLFKQ